MAIGVTSVVCGQGRYFYREMLEPEGAFPGSRTLLYARDAYNGRTLWTRDEPLDFKSWGISQWTPANQCLVADGKGRLLAYRSHPAHGRSTRPRRPGLHGALPVRRIGLRVQIAQPPAGRPRCRMPLRKTDTRQRHAGYSS